VRQTIGFFKSSINKILLAIFLWITILLIDILFFSGCILGDCIRNGELSPCCGKIRTEIAHFLLKVRTFYPLVAYLISCIIFTKNKITKLSQ